MAFRRAARSIATAVAGFVISQPLATFAADETPCGPGSVRSEELVQFERALTDSPPAVRGRYEAAVGAYRAGKSAEKLHDWRSAEKHYLSALHAVEELDIDDVPLESEIANGLGAVHQNRGDFQMALHFHRRSLHVAERFCDSSDDTVVLLQANVASALNRQEQYGEAKDILVSALSGFDNGAQRMPADVRMARAYQLRYLLAVALLYLRDYEQARTVLLQNLPSDRESLVTPPLFLADTLQLLGRIEAARGQTTAAASAFDRAIDLYQQYFPHGASLRETQELRAQLP